VPRASRTNGRLRRLRRNAGLTLPDLASEAGVSVDALRRMESGATDVLLTIALRVACCLDTEVEELFGSDPCR